MMSINKKVKVIVLIVACVLLLSVMVAIPSLARFKNRSTLDLETEWNGSVASSYRSGSGTESDPYVIADGTELAFFAENLEHTNYQDTYFVLGNDIVLNSGVFSYNKENGLTYIKNDNTYYVSPYLDDYNDVHKFKSFNNFKGYLDGKSFRIYGAFITDGESDEVGLFNNLEGNVTDLYVENSVIYGGTTTGGIASTSVNAVIKNTLFNGFVIGKEQNRTYKYERQLDDVIGNSSSLINVSDNDVIGLISDIKLSGNLVIDDDASLKINGVDVSEEVFSISLGSSISDINISYVGDDDYSLTNLVYTVSYEKSVTAGIVGNSYNTVFEGVVNKASVFGKMFASGLVGNAAENVNITYSYNSGDVTSNISSGLVSYVNNNSAVNITNSYNSGDVGYSFIGNVNNSGVVNIIKSFSTTSTYAIGSIVNSNVIVNNVAVVSNNNVLNGSVTGVFTLVDASNIKNYAKSNLGFLEYNEEEINNGYVWVYDNSTLPILFIDDQDLVIARININKHSWESFSDSVTTLKFGQSITFNIESVDNLKPIKSISYYISNSKNPLNKIQLSSVSFIDYSDVVSIKDEGFYIVYAKVVDYDDNVSYLNSDLLVVDLTGASTSIVLNNNKWDSLSEVVGLTYLNNESNVTIKAIDELSGVSSIKYILSDKVLSVDELDEVTNWINYTESFVVGDIKKIIYARVEDNCNYVTYVNSDMISIGGYSITNITGGDNSSYITANSSVSYNVKFKGDMDYLTTYKHVISLDKALPLGTTLTLVDKKNGGAYKYVVEDTEESKYSFNLFREVGRVDDAYLNEEMYSGLVDEEFNLTIDFSGASILNEVSYNLSVDLYNNDNVVLETLLSDMKVINVVPESEIVSKINLDSDFTGSIKLNSNSVNNILIKAFLDISKYNNKEVNDSNYYDKNLILVVKLVDFNDNVVSADNVSYEFKDKEYYPSRDGIVRINTKLSSLNDNLVIKTSSGNISLLEGDYTYKIGVYYAYDESYDVLVNDFISIPVVLNNSNYKSSYKFDVELDSNSRILDKLSNKTLDFKVTNSVSGSYIVATLYEKNLFSAYDQSYKEIDLAEYVNNSLNAYGDYGYVFNGNMISLDFITNKLKKNGYMIVFELYNGDKKLEEVRKHFIVR